MRRLLPVFLCACRIGSATNGGTPPRAANDFELALYPSNDDAPSLARQMLAGSPHVTVTDLDATGIENLRADCTTTECRRVFTAACSRAAMQGANYFGVASVRTDFGAKTECIKGGGDFFGHKQACVETRTSNERSSATFRLEIFDAKTCKEDERLSRHVETFANGPEETSKPEALHELTEAVPRQHYDLPDQLVVAADGRVGGEDGQYAVFRGGSYRGYARVRGGNVSSMMLGLSPRTGDVLSKRGPRRFIDVAVAFEFAWVTLDSSRESAPGIGAQLRYYSLDGGLQLAAGVDLLAGLNTRATLYGGEVGWGVPIATGVVVSGNVGAGLADGSQFTGRKGDWISSGRVLEANATARLQMFLATWVYATADLGYVHTRGFDGWEGPSATQARPMAVHSPFARVSLGIDF